MFDYYLLNLHTMSEIKFIDLKKECPWLLYVQDLAIEPPLGENRAIEPSPWKQKLPLYLVHSKNTRRLRHQKSRYLPLYTPILFYCIFKTRFCLKITFRNTFRQYIPKSLPEKKSTSHTHFLLFISFVETSFSENHQNFQKRHYRRRFPALRAGNLAIEPLPLEDKIVQVNPPEEKLEWLPPPPWNVSLAPLI